MKKLIFITIFTICGLIVSAQPTFVSTIPSNRNVIIEQFTYRGAGILETDSIINQIISENPNRVCGITAHDYMYNGTILPLLAITKDFSTKDGLFFSNYFMPWNYYYAHSDTPPAIVNRGTMEGRQTWKNSVNAILSQPSCVNVAAQGSIDWDSRQLTLTVEVYYTGNSNTNENYLTVALIQNNIEDYEGTWANIDQILPSGKYNHLRILRDIISPTWGDTIATTTQNSFFTKTYTYMIPDTIESTLPDLYKKLSIRPKVLLDNLEVIVFVGESKNNIISGNKAEIVHVNVPEINLYTQLDNIDENIIKCEKKDLPLYLTLKNGGSDTIRSIEYSVSKDNEVILQNQIWNSRFIYPFTTDTIALHNIPVVAGIESLISIEIVQLNEKDTIITVESSFIRHLAEDAQGAMTLVIAPDQFAGGIIFFLKGEDGETVLTNINNLWSDLSSPGIREYSYDFFPETTGCYSLYLSDNLNKGYGEGYFKLLAKDGTVLMYNDGINCRDFHHYINVTEPYNKIQDFYKGNISVFPNPAWSQFNVSNAQNTTLRMYNMLGQEVLQIYNENETAVIHIEHLPAGMYVLKVEKENAVFTQKVQIVR